MNHEFIYSQTAQYIISNNILAPPLPSNMSNLSAIGMGSGQLPPTLGGGGGGGGGGMRSDIRYPLKNQISDIRPPKKSNTVTPFKFAAIKVRGFEIMAYSRPFNFVVSYQNYFTVSYTNVVFSYTN